MPRFVILRHELPPGGGRASHFDLMIERGAALRTWALDSFPDGKSPVAAEELADHRLDYLSYEGPVSGDRGQVIRADEGTCELLAAGDDAWSVEFQGLLLRGRWELARESGNRWVFQPVDP